MSMFPHTITVYNAVQETDPTTFEETTKLYVTILRGVMLQASKAVNVRESGLEGADAVNLYIPFSVEAVDGTTGRPRPTHPRRRSLRRRTSPGCGRCRSTATAG